MKMGNAIGILSLCVLNHCASRNKGVVPAQMLSQDRAQYEAVAPHQMVTSQGVATSRAAYRVLEAGGNLIDAAIAASFAVSVERPQSTGLGGGGFLLYRDAKSGKIIAFDFRERAPRLATQNMFLDARGNVSKKASIDGMRAVAVPGLVAGLAAIHARYGSLPWKKLLEPAIELAETGFEVYPDLASALRERKDVLLASAEAKKIFLKADGSTLVEGDRLIQKDLARTLRIIAQKGREGFYAGPVARAIVAESRRLGGILSQADLKNYRVREREPVRGHFRNWDIVSMPPPSSGGTHVIEILNIFEALKPESGVALASGGTEENAQTVHFMASAMQAAFADRAEFLGDPEFSKIPLKGLLSKRYAQDLAAKIPRDYVRPASEISAGQPLAHESNDTTHMTLMDIDGSAVITTQTINGLMGSGVVVPGTGLILNNEMDDFSAKKGALNLFGAVGGTPNIIEPGKTPLSSMSPTLVLKNNKPVLALGSPGGTRILTCVALTLWNRLELQRSLFDSVVAVRFHQQWRPDELLVETPGLPKDIELELAKMGHSIKRVNPYCRINVIENEGNQLRGVADPRDIGLSVGR